MSIFPIQWLRPTIDHMMRVDQAAGEYFSSQQIIRILSYSLRHALTNDDFRKLLMTPAAPGSTTAQRHHGGSSSTSQQKTSSNPKFVFDYDCESLRIDFLHIELMDKLKLVINEKRRNNIMRK